MNCADCQDNHIVTMEHRRDTEARWSDLKMECRLASLGNEGRSCQLTRERNQSFPDCFFWHELASGASTEAGKHHGLDASVFSTSAAKTHGDLTECTPRQHVEKMGVEEVREFLIPFETPPSHRSKISPWRRT